MGKGNGDIERLRVSNTNDDDSGNYQKTLTTREGTKPRLRQTPIFATAADDEREANLAAHVTGRPYKDGSKADALI